MAVPEVDLQNLRLHSSALLIPFFGVCESLMTLRKPGGASALFESSAQAAPYMLYSGGLECKSKCRRSVMAALQRVRYAVGQDQMKLPWCRDICVICAGTNGAAHVRPNMWLHRSVSC